MQYHKLVRDRIPEIIEADGKTCTWETLSEEAYLQLLDKKLNEELAEYQESHPNLQICTMKVNTGGAGGFHQGIREGALAGYSHLWLMDDDPTE